MDTYLSAIGEPGDASGSCVRDRDVWVQSIRECYFMFERRGPRDRSRRADECYRIEGVILHGSRTAGRMTIRWLQ